MKGGEAIYRPREAGILQTKTEFTSGERESTPTLTLIITEERVRSLTNSNRSLRCEDLHEASINEVHASKRINDAIRTTKQMRIIKGANQGARRSIDPQD